MNSLAIRPALPGDAEAVLNLLSQFVTSYPPQRQAFECHYLSLIASDRSVFLIAAIGKEVVGK